jgi:hypothetical protein
MVTDNKSLNEIPFDTLNWDVPVNENTDWIDIALGSSSSISVTGVTATPVTLTIAQYRPKAIIFTGTLSANVTYRLPSGVGGEWVILNNATGAFTLTLDSAAGGATAVIPQGVAVQVYANGTSGVGVVQTAALPSDPKLQAIAGLDTLPGGLYQTGPSTFTKRTLTGTTDQITVTNGDGASGNPTVSAVVASALEVNTGTDNTKLMTPSRTRTAINYFRQNPWVPVTVNNNSNYVFSLSPTTRSVRFFFSDLKCSTSSSSFLRFRVSTDGGSTWSSYIGISVTTDWNAPSIFGDLEIWKQKNAFAGMPGQPDFFAGFRWGTNASLLGSSSRSSTPGNATAASLFDRVEISFSTGSLLSGIIGATIINETDY